jgi:hypothetical protein
MYTIAVQRQQVVVMDRAVASSAIVFSLFPWQVRAQIYEESANDKSTTKPRRGIAGTGVDLHTASNSAPSRPIAEWYENTTILFADMAGCTA